MSSIKDLILAAIPAHLRDAMQRVFGDINRTPAQINLLVQGLAAGKKVAAGSASITGSGNVVTGLASIDEAVVILEDDVALTGDAVSCVNHATAGTLTIKVWKRTSSSDCTPVAATVAKNVRWIAVGT